MNSNAQQFEPPADTIPIIPTAMRIAYTRTPAGEDAILIYVQTTSLGSFAFHIGPQAGPPLIAELQRIVDNLDDYRRQHREHYGDPR